MNALISLGTTFVTFALVAYSIAIITEQRKKILRIRILVFLTLGVGLDITATIFMILGSPKGGFSLHGLLGYSALLGMLIEAFLIWRIKVKSGTYSVIPEGVHQFSRYAYIWWIVAFITGGLIVAMR